MATFTSLPFNLSQNTAIDVRGAAINRHGEGDFSDVNVVATAFVLVPPAKMYMPMANNLTFTKDSVTLTWRRVLGDAMGGVPITNYTLLWDNNTNITDIVLFKSLESRYTVSGMLPSKTYKFRVQAENVCGVG